MKWKTGCFKCVFVVIWALTILTNRNKQEKEMNLECHTQNFEYLQQSKISWGWVHLLNSDRTGCFQEQTQQTLSSEGQCSCHWRTRALPQVSLHGGFPHTSIACHQLLLSFVHFCFSFFFCILKEGYYFWLYLKSKQGDMQNQSSSTWMSFYKLTLCAFVWKIYNLIV